MHQFDAGGARGVDRAGRHLAPGDAQRPGIRPHQPGGDAGEGGLARAVLADDGMDATGREAHAHIAQRHDRAVS